MEISAVADPKSNDFRFCCRSPSTSGGIAENEALHCPIFVAARIGLSTLPARMRDSYRPVNATAEDHRQPYLAGLGQARYT